MTAAAGDRARGVVTTSPPERIAEAGRNCWRIERASHFYCVQDAADYFRLVRQALMRASETVFILGWDINAHTDLDPNLSEADAPSRLDRLLAFVVRRRPQLRCYILTWDYGALYTLERDPLTRWRLGWRMPRRVRFEFDDHHPLGGCHHQKVVVVDDHLAFCGGIDLTSHRWDTSTHRLEEPARKTPVGVAYGPYHEVQAMVMGPAAACLGLLARDRWRAHGPGGMPPLRRATDDLWPSDITPDVRDADVAIARTVPASESRPGVRECEALFLDSIAASRHAIYIENQYFTNDAIARALAARLREPEGPEVIVIAPKECQGWLEKTTMGTFRDEVFRLMLAADEHKRLRLVYPTASRSRDVATFVHSKVMIVDDVLARIGSANLSHRSMGTDTECDLAVEAGDNANARTGIRHIRNRLLAEHLGVPAAALDGEIERAGSIGRLIDSREHAEHTLVRIEVPSEAELPSAVLQAVADPDEPIAYGSPVQWLVPSFDAASMHGPLRLWVLPGIVLAAAAAVVWQFSFSLDTVPSISLPVATGLFVLAGVLLIPLEILAVVAVVIFGAIRGGFVALIGSVAAAVIGYAAGRLMGASRLTNWVSPRSYRSIRQLSARGVRGVIALRLANVASAGSIHLLCGAGGLPFGTYITGTTITLIPTVLVLTGVGSLLRHTLLNRTLANGLVTIGAVALLVALVGGVRAFVLIQRFASAVSGHRKSAEFG
jgi:phosphatidylserine/phosphatidylglycerophosphate/cardiolipin synthase-like enzyme/uncharacterized membrane protein YdjX (TVP38/TMEM64 family)